jgi:hypothetical protein
MTTFFPRLLNMRLNMIPDVLLFVAGLGGRSSCGFLP